MPSRRSVLAAAAALPFFSRRAGADTPETVVVTPDLVAAAEKEGSLTLQYSSPLVTMQGVAGAFTKEYPKVRIDLERKAGSAGAFALAQELDAGVRRIDLYQGTDYAASQSLIDKGAFVAVTPANIADLDAAALPMAPWIYFSNRNVTVIAYNPQLVSDDEARKLVLWPGVLDPAFTGKVSLVEPAFGVTMAPLLYVLDTPALGEAFLRRLKAQKPSVYVDTAQARQALISGQKPISWGAQWEAVILTEIGRGAPIHFVYPEPTIVWGGTGYGVLAHAPHPHAARLFLAWILSPAGGRAEEAPYSNVLSNVKSLPESRAELVKLKGESWYRPPTKVWNPEVKDWIANGDRDQKLWEGIFGA